MKQTNIVLICKALGDSNRLQIVEMLTGGEQCACKLLAHFEITQPTLSHHMKILCESGLVKVRKEGKWAHYSLNPDTLDAFNNHISSLKPKDSKSGVCEL